LSKNILGGKKHFGPKLSQSWPQSQGQSMPSLKHSCRKNILGGKKHFGQKFV
jgi:hypothetical protein